jgi:hypothetical protein
MPLYEFEGKSSRLASSSFVHPDAILPGLPLVFTRVSVNAIRIRLNV